MLPRSCSVILICLASSSVAFAQAAPDAPSPSEPAPIRVDGGLAGSTVGGSDRNGVGFVGEIKVSAHDNIAVGQRLSLEASLRFGGGRAGHADHTQ